MSATPQEAIDCLCAALERKLDEQAVSTDKLITAVENLTEVLGDFAYVYALETQNTDSLRKRQERRRERT